MRYYLDEEFIDDGKTIDLISIGIVAEDGRELYLQSVEFAPEKASEWVRENVFTHLLTCPHALIPQLAPFPFSAKPQLVSLVGHRIHGQCTFERVTFKAENEIDSRIIGAYADCYWRTRELIKNELIAFLDPQQHGKPELYGWCAGYDWVAFCQFFGTMMDLPEGYPHYIRDLQYMLDERGIADSELPPAPGQAHNALADAQQIKTIWEWLQQ